MKLKIVCAVFAATGLCLYGWGPLPGQESGSSDAAIAAPTSSEPGNSEQHDDDRVAEFEDRLNRARYPAYTPDSLLNSPIHQPDSAIQQAVNKYRDAEIDQDKEHAKQEISTALSDYFDANMKVREEEIRDIEARVKKLQAQLERRRAAKAELLELQLKVLVNEAEGLGFYGRTQTIERPVRLPAQVFPYSTPPSAPAAPAAPRRRPRSR